MAGKAVISLTTGLEDPEKVTVAFLVAVGAAESGRPTLMFLTKEAVRLALDGVAVGVACDGCPPLPDLLKRYEAAGGRYYVLPRLLRRQEARPRVPHRQRRGARHDSDVAVDRGRGGDDLQLLTPYSRGGSHPANLGFTSS
jgi:predicted peroxiredoxin